MLPQEVRLRRLFPAAALGEIEALRPLSLGLSGAAVYAVRTAGGSYVVRLHSGDGDAWDRTLPLHRQAAAHGVAPALLHVDEAERCTVSAEVTGTPFGRALAQPDQQPAAVASLIRQLVTLHGLPGVGLPSLDPVGFATGLWQAQVARPGFPDWGRPFEARLAPGSEALARDPRRVPSHGDLNPGNMIWDGQKVWLVDWTTSGLAHPYLDLASLATFLSLPDEAALGLLSAQERAPLSEEQRSVFVKLRDIARIGYGCSFLSLVPGLTTVTFLPPEETPDLSTCFARLAAGQLDLKSPAGQAQIGAAILKQLCA